MIAFKVRNSGRGDLFGLAITYIMISSSRSVITSLVLQNTVFKTFQFDNDWIQAISIFHGPSPCQKVFQSQRTAWLWSWSEGKGRFHSMFIGLENLVILASSSSISQLTCFPDINILLETPRWLRRNHLQQPWLQIYLPWSCWTNIPRLWRFLQNQIIHRVSQRSCASYSPSNTSTAL